MVVSKLSLLAMTTMLNKEVFVCTSNNATIASSRPVSISTEENVYWTWLLFIGFSFPEVCTFIRSIRFYLFKGQQPLNKFELYPTLISEVIFYD